MAISACKNGSLRIAIPKFEICQSTIRKFARWCGRARQTRYFSVVSGVSEMNIAHVLAMRGGDVYTVSPERTIREAVALLARHNVGALVIADEAGRPVGIISERDIVREAERDERLFDRPVRDIMTADLITGAPDDDLRTVAHTMTERHIRHLPVIAKGQLVGIVSIGDVLKAQRDEYEGEVDTLQQMQMSQNQ